MACRECRAFPGRKDLMEGREERDKLVTRDRKECRVQEEIEGAKGLLEKAGPEELREQKVNLDLRERKESEALWEIREEKETKERKEKASNQVKQV